MQLRRHEAENLSPVKKTRYPPPVDDYKSLRDHNNRLSNKEVYGSYKSKITREIIADMKLGTYQ